MEVARWDAREHAFRQAGFERSTVDDWSMGPDSSSKHLLADPTFPEVPADVLGRVWQPDTTGEWLFADNIGRLENRVMEILSIYFGAQMRLE